MGNKRVMDSDFWQNVEVYQHYSKDEKLVHLYLMTSSRTNQIGIFTTPLHYIVCETGVAERAVQQILNKFEHHYKIIKYNRDLQEIAVLNILQETVLKGGSPFEKLIKRELSEVKDATLMVAIYNHLFKFWKYSSRSVDQRILELFTEELKRRIDKDEITLDLIDDPSQFDVEVVEEADDIEITKETCFAYYRDVIGEIDFETERHLLDAFNKLSVELVYDAIGKSKKANSPKAYLKRVLEDYIAKGLRDTFDLKESEAKFRKNVLNV